jgi:tRNA(Ile)-lysidine synthase
MRSGGRLRDRVAESIAAHALWSPGDRVAVAVSGGLDSVALLHLLVATAGRHRGVLSVVTVDHGTRPGSASDADFVAGLAAALGLPLARTDLALGAGASEAACRTARYAAFDGLDVDRVALAHHLDDQAETVLLRLLRGAGAAGLSGMAWRRDRFVRPLLGVRRAELTEWASGRGLSWRDDPTNADPRYLRNRVRAEVLPLLESLRHGAAPALARAAEHAAADEAFFVAIVDHAVGSHPSSLPTEWVAEAPSPLVRRALLRACPTASATHLDAIVVAARRGAGVVVLPDGVEVRIDRQTVRPGNPDR